MSVLDSTTRRRFVRTVTSAVGLGSLGVVSGSGDDTVSIPVLVSDGEVVRRDEVPAGWLDHVEQAKRVARDIRATYGGLAGVRSVARTRSEETVGGKNVSKVRVEVTDDAVADAIPDRVDGVEVTTVPAREVAATCFNRSAYDHMPGGVIMSGTGTGTAACEVERNGTRYMLTAAHLWDACNGVDSYDAYQYGRKFGSLKIWHDSADYAYANNTSDQIEFAPTVKSADGRELIVGYVTEYGTESFMSDGETMEKLGISTGETHGVITANDVSGGPGCIDLDGKGVEVDNDQAEGDSGGPVYYVDDSGDHYMTSIATLGWNYIADDSCNGASRYARAQGWPAWDLAENKWTTFYTG